MHKIVLVLVDAVQHLQVQGADAPEVGLVTYVSVYVARHPDIIVLVGQVYRGQCLGAERGPAQHQNRLGWAAGSGQCGKLGCLGGVKGGRTVG